MIHVSVTPQSHYTCVQAIKQVLVQIINCWYSILYYDIQNALQCDRKCKIKTFKLCEFFPNVERNNDVVNIYYPLVSNFFFLAIK